jgi:hypothetical protein
VSPSVSSHKKNEKKIKFGTKIEFLKTKGISYLRAKRWSDKNEHLR